MLLEQGKRIPTIEQYAACLLPMDSLADDLVVNQFGMHTAPDCVFPVENKQGRFRLVPGPEFSPRLYRGQNARWSPCRPSIHRLPRFIDKVFWVVKVFELNGILYDHPACVQMYHWGLEGLRFDFDVPAIAQHYGYPTNYLDFSRSRDVAMFFATCAYVADSSTHRPLQSGTAVIYTADLRKLLIDARRLDMLPLGEEPLPRPAAQRAFAIPLGPDEDLDTVSWVSTEEIAITPELSARYFDMFEGGKALFPDEPFDMHVDRIRSLRTYRPEALEAALSCRVLPPHPGGIASAMDELTAAGYYACSSEVIAPRQSVEASFADWDTRRQNLMNRLRLRGVAAHFQG